MIFLVLDQSTMNELRKIIDTYRETIEESALESFRFTHNGKTDYEEICDLNYGRRKDLIFELFDHYTPEDKPLVKWLLDEEFKASNIDMPVYTVDVCAFMLFKYMDMEDIYELYEAKFGGGTDRQVYLDVELIFGFDRTETKQYLLNKQKGKRKNREIINTIEYYEQNPDAKFKSRIEYIEYYETKKIPGLKADLEEMD